MYVYEMGDGSEILLRFGMMADLHYMDADNAPNFSGTKIRRFRQSLTMLKSATLLFNSKKTHFNMLLGDVIDGAAKGKGILRDAVSAVMQVESKSSARWFHTLGNHEYYNFSREEIRCGAFLVPDTASDGFNRSSSVSPSGSGPTLYYSFCPRPGFRCIVLDGYEMSTIGSLTSELKAKAEALLCAKNHAYSVGDSDWFATLSVENWRYVPFNGGVSAGQIEWMETELREAVSLGEKCIVFCHMPLIGKAASEKNVVWNCEEVLDALHRSSRMDGDDYRSAVVAVVSGHAHDGGYFRDPSSGIHHIVPPAPVECLEGEECFGICEIIAAVDGASCVDLRLRWVGKEPQTPTHPWPKTVEI